MSLDIAIEDSRWADLGFETLARDSLDTALSHLNLDLEHCEISVLACDDARIADLNAEFRGKPAPTNVLSWPATDLAAQDAGDLPDPPTADFTGEIALGDVAISIDTCLREAAEAGKSPKDHVRHLLVHGLLHLLGYDHIRDPDATVMERLEVAILGEMGIDDPYYRETADGRSQIG